MATHNKYFSGHVINLFGLKGTHHGQGQWMTTANFGSSQEPAYMLVVHDPKPANHQVAQLIDTDEKAGQFDQIFRIAVSNRVAVRLYLDGTLSQENFDTATELRIDTSTFIEGAGICDAIFVPDTRIAGHHFPMIILKEGEVGPTFMATLNSDYQIV
jgi:hypothetical protein